MSHNTVSKVHRSEETSLEPVYHRRKQPRPKLGQYEALLEALLLSNHKAPRHDRLNFLKMFEFLRNDGYAVAMMRYADMPVSGNNTMVIHKCRITNTSP